MGNNLINFITNIRKKENKLKSLELYTDSKQILKLIYEHDKNMLRQYVMKHM
jgi:hypothetical protein